jgi:hypothetical protein
MSTMSYDEKLLMLSELLPTQEQLLWLIAVVLIWTGFLLIVLKNKKYNSWKEFIEKFF